MSNGNGSLSGLTEQEAKEFHGVFVTSFMILSTVCAVGR
jgi:light-harvesting complex 1 beta chain